MTIKEPMLAQPVMQEDVEHTNNNILAALEKCFERSPLPRLATVKLDGIRALRLNGSLLSRKFIEIPNKYVRERSLILPGGFDMELYNPTMTFNQIQSVVMSAEHPDSDKIQFHILDWVQSKPYIERLNNVNNFFSQYMQALVGGSYVFDGWPLTPKKTPQELMTFFLQCEAQEGEGICFRLPNGKYKQGRSTFNEQLLMKLSRYVYEEAIITGVFEQETNTNSAITSKTGHTKRSSALSGMVGKGTLGGFMCTTVKDGKEIRVGTGEGWTNGFRLRVWSTPQNWINKTITFKHKPVGRLNKPRHPIMVGVRTKGF